MTSIGLRKSLFFEILNYELQVILLETERKIMINGSQGTGRENGIETDRPKDRERGGGRQTDVKGDYSKTRSRRKKLLREQLRKILPLDGAKMHSENRYEDRVM